MICRGGVGSSTQTENKVNYAKKSMEYHMIFEQEYKGKSSRIQFIHLSFPRCITNYCTCNVIAAIYGNESGKQQFSSKGGVSNNVENLFHTDRPTGNF